MKNIIKYNMFSTKKLFSAIKSGNFNKTKQILQSGVNVNNKNEDGWSALMVAALYKRFKIAKLLIEEYGAYINDSNNINRTPLMFAGGSEKITKLLLEKGADVDPYDIYGSTALYLTTIPTFDKKEGHIKVAKLLIKYGANPLLCFNKENPLMHASSRKLYEMMKLLGDACNLVPIDYVKKNSNNLIKFKKPINDEDKSCCICLENNINVESKCEHVFHLDCIKQIEKDVCPMCRSSLYLKQE